MKNVSIALAYTGAPGSAAYSSEGANFPARQDFIALHRKLFFDVGPIFRIPYYINEC